MKQVIKMCLFTMVFAVVGFGAGSVQAVEAEDVSAGCGYAYCDKPSGNCFSNQNETRCMGIGGQLPCLKSVPCNVPGDDEIEG